MGDRSVFLLMVLISLSPLLRALEGPEKDQPPLAMALVDTHAVFDGNRIRNYLENNGMFVSHRITGHSGMEWPQGSGLYIDFASGIWLAGRVNGEIRTAMAEYAPEFVPGPYGSDPDDPKHRIYKINRSDLAAPDRNPDLHDWPIDDGAYWIDANGDGRYNVDAGDRPVLLGDQMLWYVANDGDTLRHKDVFNTLPLGVEVQMTIWGYDRGDSFGDMMFVKSLLINKGDNLIDSAYFGIWVDPDLGYAGDDFVGCDTSLNLSFAYNDGPDVDYGAAPPAMGYLILQGPVVPSFPDTAYAFGQELPGFKNLPMTSFDKFT